MSCKDSDHIKINWLLTSSIPRDLIHKGHCLWNKKNQRKNEKIFASLESEESACHLEVASCEKCEEYGEIEKMENGQSFILSKNISRSGEYFTVTNPLKSSIEILWLAIVTFAELPVVYTVDALPVKVESRARKSREGGEWELLQHVFSQSDYVVLLTLLYIQSRQF